MSEIIGFGGKDGGSGHTATEAANSLRSKAYASVIDLISEGEIEGLVDGFRSIYFNNVPLQTVSQGELGLYNFQGVHVETRNGTQSQGYLDGWPDIESEEGVNVVVKKDTPYTTTITTNAGVNALRVKVAIPQLSSMDTSTGDINGTEVEIAIELQSNQGGYVQVVSDKISGKTMARYERAYRINLTGAGPWNLKVSRITPDSTLASLSNATEVSSITKITESKLSYPNSAMVAIKIDASQFSGIPTRAYDVKLLKIKIPVNYNPTTRVYSGIWDGTFKTAWSDNPAWCYYDLITNARYGLGDFVSESAIDKWSLYKIAKYCDHEVDNGFGGKEPRFSMNCYLQTRAEAYKVIIDLASAFRGITFWSSGSVTMAQDSSSDPVNLFTNANVINGEFQYMGSSIKTRHTVAIVTWNDMADMCRQKVEYVEDTAGIERYGIVQTDIIGFGCTSRAQAHRLGQWILLSERTETESASFKTALEGALVYPGAVIKVRDNNRYGDRFGGRIASSTTSSITLDSTVTLKAGKEYVLYVTFPNSSTNSDGTVSPGGSAKPFVITNGSGDTDVLRVSSFSGQVPNVGSLWILSETGSAKDKLYRVISVTESLDGQCEVSALEHNAEKFDLVDKSIGPGSFIGSGGGGTSVTPTVLGSTISMPTGLKITPRVVMVGAVATIKIDVSWNSQSEARYFNLDWKWGKDDYTSVLKISSGNYTIESAKEGYYYVRVRAIGLTDSVISGWAYAAAPFATGAVPENPKLLSAAPGFLEVRLDWEYPTLSTGLALVEIYASTTAYLDDDIKIGTVDYPGTSFIHKSDARHATLPPGMQHWYRIRLKSQYNQYSAKFPSSGIMSACNVDVTGILNGLTNSFLSSEFFKVLTGEITPINFPNVPAFPSLGTLETAIGGLNHDLDDLDFKIQTSISNLEGSVVLVELEAARILKNINSSGETILHSIIENQTVNSKVNDGVASLQESYNVVQNGAALEANNRMVLSTSVGNTQAAIAQEQLARSDGEHATAQSLSVLAASVDNGTSSAKALIVEQSNVTVSLTSAQATKVTELSATVTQNKLTTDAQILERANVSADLISATASQVSLLTATVKNNETASKALIFNESIATANLTSSQATKTSALEANFTNSLNNVAWAAHAAVVQNSQALATDNLAQASQITGIIATIDTNGINAMGMVAEESKARANQVSAEAFKVSEIVASVANKTTASNSAINNLSTAQSNLESSQAASTTMLLASVKQGNDSSQALIVEQSRVMADLASAQAFRVTALQASFDTGTANNNATAINQAITFANDSESFAQSISSLQASFNNGIAASNALIVSESTARATATQALAQSISGLSATFGEGLGAITAKVITQNLAMADANGTLASQITQVSSGVGSMVEQSLSSSKTISNIKNQYIVRLAADGMTVAGFGLVSDTAIQTGVTTSTFAINANKFVVTDLDSGGTQYTPFQITGGKVYARHAIIEVGDIKTANIGTGNVETLNIKGNAVTVTASYQNVANVVALQMPTYGSFAEEYNYTYGTNWNIGDGHDYYVWSNVAYAYLTGFDVSFDANINRSLTILSNCPGVRSNNSNFTVDPSTWIFRIALQRGAFVPQVSYLYYDYVGEHGMAVINNPVDGMYCLQVRGTYAGALNANTNSSAFYVPANTSSISLMGSKR